MKKTAFLQYIVALILILPTCRVFAAELNLNDCGVIIGHEMGGWEFFSPTPNPKQVDRVLETDLKFVKISLRKLKDGTWVVHHNPDLRIYPTPDTNKKISLDQVTWEDVQKLKAQPFSKIPIYRLEEYIQRDQGRLCWMFTPKVSPDENLVKLILKLGIQHRSIFTTSGVAEVAFLASFPEEYGVNFAGRVGASEDALEAYRPYLSRLWAMELDPTPNAPAMINAIHKLGLRAYLDSMRYSKTYEFLGSACHKVFAMGANITQTNRPQACIKKMGASL